MEFQLYSFANLGAAKRVPGTGSIIAVYGSFGVNVDVGDAIGYGDRVFSVFQKHSFDHIELRLMDGSEVSFEDDSTSVFRHAYYYAEGVCRIQGNRVIRISGDYFFNVSVSSDLKSIYLDGSRYRVADVADLNNLSIEGSCPEAEGVKFVLKMLPLSLHVSLLRVQSLAGPSEENFSIAETIDGFVRMRANGHGHGTFRPIVIGSGPDSDFGYHKDHLIISKNGQIGIGKNYASPSIGFPTSAKLHVWRDGVERHRPNGDHDVKLVVLETNHGGPGPRQVHIGSFNNFHAGYVQGYVDPAGKTPGPLTINPLGGAVAINTGTKSALSNTLEVNGVVAPHVDASHNLGAPSHRWAALHSATGIIQTSDESEKQDALSIPDDLIDAFLDVEPRVFRWRASVTEKGDAARHHLGYVAQEIAAALARRGLDPARFGLWCRDELTTAVETAEGAVEQQPTGAYRQALRYDQLLALIDAANRRRLARIEDRLHALEARL